MGKKIRNKKICFHIGSSDKDFFWIDLYREFKDNYNLNCVFISDRLSVAKFLNANGIEAYSLEGDSFEDNNYKIKDAIQFLDEINYKDFKEVIFTEIFFHKSQEKLIIKKAVRFLRAAERIIPKVNNVDIFIDFAGDELGHNIFDIIAVANNKSLLKYRESLFPDRLIFTENNFTYWEFNSKNSNKEDIKVLEYINRFINDYFESKKTFWGSPKSRDFVFKLNLHLEIDKIFSPVKWKDVLERFKRYLNKYLVKFLYDDLTKIDTKKIIFYFPLHYPKDSQITFRGRPFLDQIEFALNLYNFLPYNSQLIIKEHPHARGAIPYKKLRKLKKFENIVLLDSWINNHIVLEKVDHVIVINSTVGLEALYRGKHVISIGKNYLNGHGLVTEYEKFYDLFSLYRMKKYKPNEGINFRKFLISAYYSSFDLPVSSVLNRKRDSASKFAKIVNEYIK